MAKYPLPYYNISCNFVIILLSLHSTGFSQLKLVLKCVLWNRNSVAIFQFLYQSLLLCTFVLNDNYKTMLGINIILDQDFDGGGFIGLSEEEFKELFPSKKGTVKKLIRVQQTVCQYAILHCMYICMYIYMYICCTNVYKIMKHGRWLCT